MVEIMHEDMMTETYERESRLNLEVVFSFVDDNEREEKLNKLMEAIAAVGYCCHYNETID